MNQTQWADTEAGIRDGIRAFRHEAVERKRKARELREETMRELGNAVRLQRHGKAAKITTLVAELFHVKPEDMLGKKHTHCLVVPRQIVWSILRDRGWSYPQIGRYFDKHHTSIISGCKALGMRRNKQEDLDSMVKFLSSRLTCGPKETSCQ